jgi:hypothetical protein
MMYTTDEIAAAARSYKKRRMLSENSSTHADQLRSSECSSAADDNEHMSGECHCTTVQRHVVLYRLLLVEWSWQLLIAVGDVNVMWDFAYCIHTCSSFVIIICCLLTMCGGYYW